MRRGGIGATLVFALGAAITGAVAGCDDGKSGGSLVIVNNSGGGGGNNNPGGGGNTQPGSFTLVKNDPGGGTILESADASTRKIAGVFTDDVLLEAKFKWILDAPVFIGDDSATDTATITIQAGTTIYGRGGTPPSMLVIRRGSRILADGTAQQPIVFTSNQPAGQRAPGDWGGLIINGRAPVNNMGPGGTLPVGEGGSGQYGGTDPNDDSGVLRYVRVEFAGHVFTSDDELNGIAFQGVGRGTVVDYIQVHRNADDGVEFFGGTVDVKHVLVTGALDDSFDWTYGWQGRAQFVVLQQWDGGADMGVEADNNETSNDLAPRSHARISNMTIVGPAGTAGQSATGLLLRRGTAANVANSIVMEMNGAGLDVDQNATWNHAYSDAPGSYTVLSGNLTVRNCIFFNNGASGSTHFRDDAGEPQLDSVFSGQQSPANQVGVDPQLGAPTSQSAPNFRPAAGGPAVQGVTWHDLGDPFFTPVTFIGAMGPNQADDWTVGWTTTAPN